MRRRAHPKRSTNSLKKNKKGDEKEGFLAGDRSEVGGGKGDAYEKRGNSKKEG